MVEVVLVCEKQQCPSAPRARQVLDALAAARPAARCRVAGQADRAWVRALGVMITPAFVIDGRVTCVGVPNEERLLQIVDQVQAARSEPEWQTG